LFAIQNDQRPEPEPNVDPDISEAVRMSLSQATTQLAELEAEKYGTIEADEDRSEYARYLNRVGWARHLKGLKRAWLLAMARKPTTQERGLYEVIWAARMVMWKAQQAAQASVVGEAAVFFVNRREVGGMSNDMPLNTRQTEKTMIRYSNQWLSIIAYIWRTHDLPVVKPRSDNEMEGRRPPYHINGKQYACMERIKAIVCNKCKKG
jgi:hypothetical protein